MLIVKQLPKFLHFRPLIPAPVWTGTLRFELQSGCSNLFDPETRRFLLILSLFRAINHVLHQQSISIQHQREGDMLNRGSTSHNQKMESTSPEVRQLSVATLQVVRLI